MNFLESIRVAMRGLRANKLRSILTMLGIIIGVFAVIVMVAIGQGAKASVTSQIQGLGSNLLMVSPGQARSGGVNNGAGSLNNMTMADVEAIKKASAVKNVAPSASKGVQIVMGNQNTSTQAIGTTAEFTEVRNQKVAQGRFFTEQEINTTAKVAVVGTSIVENLTGDPNGQIVGKTIIVSRIPFLVIGVLESKGASGMQNNDDQILIPITTAQRRLIGSDAIRTIFVEAQSADLMDTASTEITGILRKQHKLTGDAPDDFRIQSQADILSTVSTVTQSLTLLLAGIAGISLLVGGIGIMNIMLVSVTERTREIGIRKAIGAKRRDILFQFLIEAVVLSVLGGVTGILLGYGGARLLSNFIGMATEVSVAAAGMAFAFSAAIGVIFGVFPAQKASKLNPIDALRYE
ncbi:MAG TPA: ABC transporter permease [Verrucomicrobiae bacterium]|nr:ABC transporter permease [Verrucomicrobiae bacterium]